MCCDLSCRTFPLGVQEGGTESQDMDAGNADTVGRRCFSQSAEVLNCSGLPLCFSMQLPDPLKSMHPLCAPQEADSRAR